MNISLASFHACCGMRILWNFGNEGGGANIEIDIKELEKELKAVLKSGTKNMYERGRTPIPKSAMLLIAVNETQNKLMKEMLLKNGFKLVSKGWNGQHKNINYLYSLERKKPIKRKIKELIS